jgi:hypothetical protein
MVSVMRGVRNRLRIDKAAQQQQADRQARREASLDRGFEVTL